MYKKYVYFHYTIFHHSSMGSLSNRQSILRPTSTRAAVAQQGLAQHVTPRPVSGRFMAAHLGVGRDHAASVDVLHRHLPVSVSAEIAHFYQLRAEAERIRQQLAAHDRRRSITAKEAGYPAPFLNPEQQRRFRQEVEARDREKRRLLDEANRFMKSLYLPRFLRPPLVIKQSESDKNKADALVAPKPRPGAIRAIINGGNCFMPLNFWQSQNPTDIGPWTGCAKTVYAMLATFYEKNSKAVWAPSHFDLVLEHTNAKWSHGYHTRDYYVGANGARSAQGMELLDKYMEARIPVMVGVSHTEAV